LNLRQFAPVHGLTDRNQHIVSLDDFGLVFVKLRRKTLVFVEYRETFLEFHTGNLAVSTTIRLGPHELLMAMPSSSASSISSSRAGISFSAFKTEHVLRRRAGTNSSAGNVNGHVSTTDNYRGTAQLEALVKADLAQNNQHRS
jgi:hypothetical protein